MSIQCPYKLDKYKAAISVEALAQISLLYNILLTDYIVAYFFPTQLSAWARPDAIDTVDYGLSKAADILDYFGEYYGTKFPLDKMGTFMLFAFNCYSCYCGLGARPASCKTH